MIDDFINSKTFCTVLYYNLYIFSQNFVTNRISLSTRFICNFDHFIICFIFLFVSFLLLEFRFQIFIVVASNSLFRQLTNWLYFNSKNWSLVSLTARLDILFVCPNVCLCVCQLLVDVLESIYVIAFILR